tara:strand:+ start:264 stop:689 length:426 start_codon:yes stop_codon:yes gene_type:complete
MKHLILKIKANGQEEEMKTGTSHLPTATEEARKIFNVLHKMDKDKPLEIAICDPDDPLRPLSAVIRRKAKDAELERLKETVSALHETTLGLKTGAILLSLATAQESVNIINFNNLKKNALQAKRQVEVVLEAMGKVKFSDD